MQDSFITATSQFWLFDKNFKGNLLTGSLKFVKGKGALPLKKQLRFLFSHVYCDELTALSAPLVSRLEMKALPTLFFSSLCKSYNSCLLFCLSVEHTDCLWHETHAFAHLLV